MLALITGGSASGKSEYAENLAVKLGQGNLVYLATMICYDKETEKRIERHRLMRKDKGFSTVECPTCLKSVQIPPNSTVLLECLSNLAANERFDPAGCKNNVPDEIMKGIQAVLCQCRHLVVVSNEVFSDGMVYDRETEEYLKDLGELNRRIGELADFAAEVVYSIPVIHKGENLE
ncbi:MAG: bifunctional adenosylcobinamide kinase/adenosylcobinamide-phosphate guanylyltransferase [Massiliimalia sp.]|jgi:adenosylcobinamide kinase/adenosylcobinamide-phosphate guanylyltransferase